ncbi:MAG: DUF3127 domain-containing protein [Prevotella sp.]|nr:DUF3127 domain-containing protein [Prevotella sp.]
MELQGKVIAAIPARKGTSARGEWVAQDFVIETHENFPHKMVFSVFGQDRLDRFNIQVGQEVDVFFDIDAHEYNGRWFNSIRAYDVRQVDPATIGMMVAPQAAPAAAPGVAEAAPVAGGAAPVAENPFPPQQPAAEGTDDDLPF